ncbi:MAG: cyanophycin synthetase, partial [Xanthomonadales bacterium]|nr:cyanophycin synthetase [Xanthomonadales bacterium]
AEVKRTVAEIAQDTCVLNADDPRCLKMAAYTEAKHVCYVTMNPNHQIVRAHIRAGGRAVVLEQGMNGHMIALYDRGVHNPLLWTHLIPATMEGRAMHNVNNAMFAAAMAYGLGVHRDHIEHGLRTFTTSFFQAPGRMNIFDEHPFKVIMDYGHNANGVAVIAALASRLPVTGRRLVVMAAPGDRRDSDILELAEAAAGHFDHYICKGDDNRRGRREGEVVELLRQGLTAKGVTAEQITGIDSEREAIEAGLKMARPGDLLVVFADNIPRSWKQIIYFKPEFGAAAPARPNLSESPASASALAGLPGLETFGESAELELITDGRGVLIAPEAAD